MKKSQQSINILEFKPRQNARWEADAGGRVVLLIPKFKSRFLAKWLTPRLPKPNFRVKLDAFGSFVWKQCDGKTSAAEIADKMKTEFGNSAEPADDRVSSFLLKLERSKFICLRPDESQ